MLTLATLALGVHAMMDGVALIDHSGHAGHHGHHEDGSLALGVILHRLPLGLTLWWMVNSKLGLKAAFTTLGGLIGATCLGYFAGDEIIHSFSNDNLSIFQALMGGAILHIAFDSGHQPPSLKPANATDCLIASAYLEPSLGSQYSGGLLSITLSPARLKASSMLARPLDVDKTSISRVGNRVLRSRASPRLHQTDLAKTTA